MNRETTNDILNRLLVIHNRSLPMYLSSATPWWTDQEGGAARLLNQIVSDQRDIVSRVGLLIGDMDGEVDLGEYPMLFTSYHDLSGDFLLSKMIEYQERSVCAVEQMVDLLVGQTEARQLVQEALGTAKAHLDMMTELAGRDSGVGS